MKSNMSNNVAKHHMGKNGSPDLRKAWEAKRCATGQEKAAKKRREKKGN